jgi:hypothetical protein
VPTVLYADAGETVRVTNGDQLLHNVVGLFEEIGYNDARAGAVIEFAFDEPGLYPYACTLHIGMVGVIVVGDAAEGVENLPAVADARGGDGGMALLAATGMAVFGVVAVGGTAVGVWRVRRR